MIDSMSVPDGLTLGRVVLAPLFFCVFFLGRWYPGLAAASTVGAGSIFVLIEASDLLDGFLARRLRRVSDLGKLMDPFADSLSRLTYFVCFAAARILPFWILMLLIYRDVAVAFARTMANRRGIVMAARVTGKVKAGVYAVATAIGLLWIAGQRALIPSGESTILKTLGTIAFFLCAGVAVASLVDYLVPVMSHRS